VAANGPVVEGVVLDPDGRDVPDVVIRASFGRRGPDCYTRHCGDEVARTDSAGRFRLDVPDRSQWGVVEIDAPGFAQPESRIVRSYGTTFLRAPGGGVVAGIGLPGESAADGRVLGLREDARDWPRQRIVLERGGAVSGVVERMPGVLAANARVQLFRRDGPGGMRVARALTDERGGFSAIVPGPVFVHVTFNDEEGYRLEARQGPVAPGTSGLHLVLSNLVPLAVRLRTPEGPFCGGLDVRLRPVAQPGFELPTSYEYVDEDRFAIGWQVPGEYEFEAAPHDGAYLPVRGRVAIPCAPVDIDLPLASRIEGELEGEALEGFEVTWTGPCNPAVKREWETQETASKQFGRAVRTGPDGHFLIEGVGGGEGDIYARREDDPRCALVSSCRPTRGVLRIPLSEGRAIGGHVEPRPGITLASLRVRASSGAATQHGAVRADGSFAIVGLPPGRFRVELLSQGFPYGEWVHDVLEDVEAGAETTLRVRLPDTDAG
jgi:hypothetical protein